LFNVLIKNAKDTKKDGQKGLLINFLDPSSPRLASGLPGPSNYFNLKEPARLGEPVTSGVSLGSPGRAAMVPSPFFSINRCEGELGKGFKHSALREIREKKKKEEKTKPRHYRIVIVINLYIVLCSVFFVRPSVSFVFKI